MKDTHFTRSAAYPEFKMEARWLERHLPAQAKRTLEVGCGGGGMLARLTGCRVVGIDPFPDGLEETRRRVPGVPLVCADGAVLPFADGSFDAVIVQHVVEHISDARTAMGEWHRVLAPNGVLLIVTPNAWFVDPAVFADDTHVHIYQAREIRSLTSLSGFRPVDLRSIGLPWFRKYGSRPGLWRLRRWVLGAAEALSEVLGLRWRGQSLCSAALKLE